MALVVGGVSVDLTANAAQILNETRKAAQAVDQAARRMQTSTGRWAAGFNNAERRINASLGGIGRGLRSIQGLLLTFGAGLGAREVIRYADSYKLVTAQLKLVTGSAEEADEVQERLFRSAQQLGVGVEALNTIFIRTARNAESLGVSQDEVVRATEALGAAVKVSGTSATEAQNALIQLSQSFASGVLRGDELRSVSEQLPPVLDAVAQATGKTRQEVINFARENGLAADLVIESVTRMRDTWVRQANELGGTVEQSMQRIRDAIQRTVGKAGEAGAFQPLIDSLEAFAGAIRSGETVNAIKSFFDEMDRRWQSTAREAARFGFIVTAIMEGRFADAMDAATGRLQEFEESFTKITRAQAVALGVPIPQPQRPITPTPTGQGPTLELTGGAPAGGRAGDVFGPPAPPAPRFDPSRFRVSSIPSPQFGPESPGAGVLEEIARGEQMKALNIEMEKLNAGAVQFAATFGQAFAGLVTGQTTFAQFAQSILRNMIAMAAQAAITAALGAAVRSAFGDASAAPQTAATATTVLSTLTAILGGGVAARQHGGPVGSGQPYLVGERGPELFVPSRAGQIVPNSQLGGGMGGMAVTINAQGAQRGVATELRQLVRQPGFARDLAQGLAPVIAGDPGLRRAMGKR